MLDSLVSLVQNFNFRIRSSNILITINRNTTVTNVFICIKMNCNWTINQRNFQHRKLAGNWWEERVHVEETERSRIGIYFLADYFCVRASSLNQKRCQEHDDANASRTNDSLLARTKRNPSVICPEVLLSSFFTRNTTWRIAFWRK